MIGEKFEKEVLKSLELLLEKNLAGIKDAYLKSERGLAISFRVKVRPSTTKNGFMEVQVGISFVRLKTKEVLFLEINELQDPLFKAVEKLRPKKSSGIDAITISESVSGKSVILQEKE